MIFRYTYVECLGHVNSASIAGLMICVADFPVWRRRGACKHALATMLAGLLILAATAAQRSLPLIHACVT